MDTSIDVTIPIEPEAAAALTDPRNREAVGRLISRVLRPRSGPSALARAIAELKLEARAAGLTDAEIGAELAAYNAERRDGSSSTPRPLSVRPLRRTAFPNKPCCVPKKSMCLRSRPRLTLRSPMF